MVVNMISIATFSVHVEDKDQYSEPELPLASPCIGEVYAISYLVSRDKGGDKIMKLILQIAVCSGLSVVFKNLLYAYWEQKEGYHQNHLGDSWVFGVLAGVIIGLLVIEGWISISTDG